MFSGDELNKTNSVDNISYLDVQNSIATATPYDEVLIIARDSGVTPTMPAWFNTIILELKKE